MEKILGFGARIIKSNDKSPKYINTPENEIYVKSKILYGSYFARTAIDKANECLLVEGYTDVVSLHQAGIENVVASGGTSLTVDQLRLVKKFTNNLTIIYDGDNAGVKAALRGLDLALEEGLDVKLVLIPDKEDPDSYVNKIGTQAFIEFVKNNKKDFILFQLDIALNDAGTDSSKKAIIVNQMAETISRINKAEDFTRRQDYIKTVSEKLKIEENGFNALVNKVIRDKMSKEEFKSTKTNFSEIENPTPSNDNIDQLLYKDEQHEQALVRCLLEFGLMEWDNETVVADFIFNQIDESDLSDFFDNHLLIEIIKMYRKWFQEDLKPNSKTFLYLEDKQISEIVMNLMHVELEISPNWKEYYDGHIPTREELYKEEVFSIVNYLQLRKTRRLILQNQLELENSKNIEDQLILIQTHQHLKNIEIELTKKIGTVIIK